MRITFDANMKPVIHAVEPAVEGADNQVPRALRGPHSMYMDLEVIASATKEAKRILDGCPFMNRPEHGLRRFLASMREGYVTACQFSQRQSQLVNHFRPGLQNLAQVNRVVAHETRELMRFYNTDFSPETRMLQVVVRTVLGRNQVLNAVRDFRRQFRNMIERTLSDESRQYMDRMIETGTPSSDGTLATYARSIFMAEAGALREHPTFAEATDDELA